MKQGIRLEVESDIGEAGMCAWRLWSLSDSGEWEIVRHGVGSTFDRTLADGANALELELQRRIGTIDPSPEPIVYEPVAEAP